MINRIQSQITDISLIQQPLELNHLQNESLDLVQPFINAKNITVVRNFTTETWINGDETHLKEVFVNLFRNAIEAMDQVGRLTVSCTKTKKESHHNHKRYWKRDIEG